jgi:hypothetical protein
MMIANSILYIWFLLDALCSALSIFLLLLPGRPVWKNRLNAWIFKKGIHVGVSIRRAPGLDTLARAAGVDDLEDELPAGEEPVRRERSVEASLSPTCGVGFAGAEKRGRDGEGGISGDVVLMMGHGFHNGLQILHGPILI